jgi:mRNA-degrading endonuclease RelE of RelBE toxin-antitoxin system
MSFDILIYPKIFDNIPSERKKQIIKALNELKDPFPGGSKSKIEGYKEEIYRLRVGNYRAMYRINFEKKEVFVYEILTAEQAYKKYDRL